MEGTCQFFSQCRVCLLLSGYLGLIVFWSKTTDNNGAISDVGKKKNAHICRASFFHTLGCSQQQRFIQGRGPDPPPPSLSLLVRSRIKITVISAQAGCHVTCNDTVQRRAITISEGSLHAKIHLAVSEVGVRESVAISRRAVSVCNFARHTLQLKCRF